MNIVNKLTLRQLKLNKKRTLVTIIGTIISAAMITAVATLALSLVDLMQRDAIARVGEWHAKYVSINKEQLSIVQADAEVKKVILSRELGYSILPGSQNSNKPYLYYMELSGGGYEKFPIELADGRFPEKKNEIIVSEAVLSNAKVNYHLGDKLKVKLGHRVSTLQEQDRQANQELKQQDSLQWEENEEAEYLSEEAVKSYTIVGFMKAPVWEYTWAPGYTVLSYMDENSVAPEEAFDTSVIYKKVKNNLFDHAREILPESKIEFNDDLLRYYGVVSDDTVRQMLYILCGIIMTIIVIGSISLIYNAFAISVSERSRYLGMLSSVGATRKQKRNSVFFEGAVIGLISIPLGIGAGLLGLAITFICINPIIMDALNVGVGFRLTVYPITIVIAVLVSSVTILISTYIPARRASNVSAIDAIRQSTDIRINRRQVHTLGITRKVFGLEGDLGLKNLKRNRKRYQATVFSLIISMMLFLVVTDFTDAIQKSIVMAQSGINFDVYTIINTEKTSEKERIIKDITTMGNITGFSRLETLDTATWIEEKDIAAFLTANKEEFIKDGKYPYTVTLNAIEEEALLTYAGETGVSVEELTDVEHPAAIVIDTINYKDSEKDIYVKAKALNTKVGNNLELKVKDADAGTEDVMVPIRVAHLTDKLPMGVPSKANEAEINIVVSRKVYDKLITGKEEIIEGQPITYVFFNSSQPMKLQEQLEAVQNSVGVDKIRIRNLYRYRKQEDQIMLLAKVFTYAFLLLITAICVANIINTISTSIALRKKEFAMLKSVGITPKGFDKMLNFESLFYGIKALIYGLPISIGVTYLTHQALKLNFDFPFQVPFGSIVTVVISVFIIVGTAMLYSSSKVKKENIIDALKQDIA